MLSVLQVTAFLSALMDTQPRQGKGGVEKDEGRCQEAEGEGWTGHSGVARQCNRPGRSSSFWAVWSCQVDVWGQSQLSQSPHSPPRVLLKSTPFQQVRVHGSLLQPEARMKDGQSGLCAQLLPPGFTVTQVMLSPAFPQPKSSQG